jgi:putative thioredoxin
LSPVLERLANAGGGSWVLAKVDVDANPRISQALQVQSIPTIFAVIGGQLIPGFQGALPEAQVREFVDAVLAAGREAGLSGAAAAPEQAEAEPPAEPEDPRFTAAEQALEAGDYDLAVERYQAILGQEPANEQAQLAIGQVRLLQRVEGLDQAAASRADAAPDDIDAQLAAADLALAARTSGDERERVRTRLLEFFDLLGPEDPRVPDARRRLARALF